jgi:hypothetical protein
MLPNTKDALKPLAKDEVSSVKFLKNACAVLNAPEQAGAMQPDNQTTA